MAKQWLLIGAISIFICFYAGNIIISYIQQRSYRSICTTAAQRQSIDIEGAVFDELQIPLMIHRDYICRFKRIDKNQVVSVIKFKLKKGEFQNPRTDIVVVVLGLSIVILMALVSGYRREKRGK